MQEGWGALSLSGLSVLMSHCSIFLLAAVVLPLHAVIPPVRRTLGEPSVGLAEGPLFKTGLVLSAAVLFSLLLCYFSG